MQIFQSPWGLYAPKNASIRTRSNGARSIKGAYANLEIIVNIVMRTSSAPATRGGDSSNSQYLHNPSQALPPILLSLPPITLSLSPPAPLLGSPRSPRNRSCVYAAGPKKPHWHSCILTSRMQRIRKQCHILLLAKHVLEISTGAPANVPFATSPTICSAWCSTIASRNRPRLEA